jgi:exodeoxyribonuclease V
MSEFEWSDQQADAINAVWDWFNAEDRAPVFRLFGFAGTGKTTVARHIGKKINGTVLFGCYTGKAASVLRKMGADAQTIHSLIYIFDGSNDPTTEVCIECERTNNFVDPNAIMWRCQNCDAPQPKSRRVRSPGDKGLRFRLNLDSIVKDAALVVIDEISMVGEPMAFDLLSFGTPVLAIGDPAQLPPVKGGAGFFMDQEPDIMLTDTKRQERDNPIISLSARVREGGQIPGGKFGETEVVWRKDIGCERTRELVLDADQVLVGLNRTRRCYNKRIRELLNFTETMPMPGEKLVCLRNDHPRGFFNGTAWRVVENKGVVKRDPELAMRTLRLVIKPWDDDDEGELHEIKLNPEVFETGKDDLACWSDHDQFTFGYALTVHKSQGSQWDKVVLFNESCRFRQRAANWLYTGVTRAAKKLTVIR